MNDKQRKGMEKLNKELGERILEEVSERHGFDFILEQIRRAN